MNTSLIITLGTRDVAIDPNVISKLLGADKQASLQDRHGNYIPRRLGAALIDHYPEIAAHIQLPIIQPAIDKLKAQRSLPDYVILIVTNQFDQQERYSQKDTLYYGELLKAHLPSVYASAELPSPEVRLFYVTHDAIRIDKMYDLFRAELRNPPFEEVAKHDTVYLLNQGGIDGINNALMFNAVTVFGSKLVLLGVDEGGRCFSLDFVRQVTKEYTRRAARIAIETYQYSALQTLDLRNDIKSIAGYADARLHFDFEQCLGYLDRLSESLSDFEERQRSYLGLLTDDDKLLQEVYHNAWVKYKQGAYVDLLFRFFRINEELTRSAAMTMLSFPFNEKSWPDDIDQFLYNNNKLKDFLEEKDVDFWKPTTTTFFFIAKFFSAQQGPHQQRLRTVVELYNKLKPLSEMRNKSIGAHAFNPVSKELIENKLKNYGTSLHKIFSSLDKYFSITANPFDEINETLQQLMQNDR